MIEVEELKEKEEKSVEGTHWIRGVSKQSTGKDWEMDIWEVRDSGGLKEQEKFLRSVGTDPVELIGP